MKLLFEQLGIALCGLVTTILVVIVNVVFLHWTGWDLVGTSVNLIPVGAIAGGAIAASGYYFGALYSHSTADRSLLVVMVIIAALAQVLMYRYDYLSLNVDGTAVSKLMSFSEFIRVRLTTTHLRLGRSLFDIGAVGWFGYVLGLRSFVGFLIGGLFAFFLLESNKQCPSCKLYLDTLGSKEHVVDNADSATAYLDGFAKLLNGDNTSLATISKPDTVSKPGPESLRISMTLLRCPVCKRQFTERQVALLVGNDWKEVDSLARDDEVATGVDLVSYFGRDKQLP
jgi:hypothetical protein